MRTFVIGDIQGCYSALRRLLDHVNFEPDTDKIWGAGDLIGRGPESLQTLRFFTSLGDNANSVLGNHDLHFLAIHSGIKSPKTQDKFAPILNATDRDALVDWLRRRPMTWMPDADTLLSHAGLYPDWTIKQASELGSEVEEVLRSADWQELLTNMYTNNAQAWGDDLPGLQRQVFIINALTRMRWVNSDLKLDLQSKSGLNDVPEGLYPWFSHPRRKLSSGQRVLFGHWAALAGTTGQPNCIALDTGYIWGGKLTTLELENGRVYQI
ncbi:symmetrical bis(5'-nucleosyl)-tetraphosphatase [Lacimicrobium alkaliphilum]|uniref:bis(5'-nucleosyl)-tetraphosphatase (symmetrical) n=1 Tax=Lacimicrobium alkaliphilum TaxID=1526571 RepID=A0ABQ1QZB9_9ALTE|nr:symmetrical bis(5'-nucleosyl)-tetraphosphatase [Lacimicrobium alkaliphilum]GGD48801.1 bis(5'-nucleosyl)-tetraphosphatase, symmetrical [Lacimicrobium alkaliphilum]